MTCGALALAGGVSSMLTSCSTLTVYKTGAKDQIVLVPLAEMNAIDKKIIRVTNLEYDLLLVKKSDSLYKALVLKCSHQDWLLSAGAKSINCTAHGSIFDFDGRVLNGPASLPLSEFPAVVMNSHIQIKIIS